MASSSAVANIIPKIAYFKRVLIQRMAKIFSQPFT